MVDGFDIGSLLGGGILGVAFGIFLGMDWKGKEIYRIQTAIESSLGERFMRFEEFLSELEDGRITIRRKRER